MALYTTWVIDGYPEVVGFLTVVVNFFLPAFAGDDSPRNNDKPRNDDGPMYGPRRDIGLKSIDPSDTSPTVDLPVFPSQDSLSPTANLIQPTQKKRWKVLSRGIGW